MSLFGIPLLKPIRVKEISDNLGAELIGEPDVLIDNISTIQSAGKSSLTFLSNPKYYKYLSITEAAACIMKIGDVPAAKKGTSIIVSSNPHYFWAKTLDFLFPNKSASYGFSKSAFIDERASISSGVYIGHNSVIGNDVIIGENTHIGHNVTLENVTIGKNCVIGSGARIGQDGFGFVSEGTNIIKVKQLGRVLIGDNVEIGANTCIDRGAIDDTVIGDNTKIDNLVQIAHNVKIGKNCFIAGQVGISGSTTIGNYVMLGGQSGISGHLEVEDYVSVAGGSGVGQDIESGKIVGGYPAIDMIKWHRQTIALKNLK